MSICPHCSEKTVPTVDKLMAMMPGTTYRCRQCKQLIDIDRRDKLLVATSWIAVPAVFWFNSPARDTEPWSPFVGGAVMAIAAVVTLRTRLVKA